MTAPVVVLTNERDLAADEVIRRLQAANLDVRRYNIESARRSSVPSWHAPQILDDGELVVWWRQFETDDRPDDLDEVDDVLVQRAQWRAWLSTLDHRHACWVNDLWSARRAENKVEQLRVAGEAGLSIPRTVMTNDPRQAAAFRDEAGAAVVKTLAAGYFAFSDQSFVFTEMLSDELLNAKEIWYEIPLVIQESLVDALDARVISFGEHVFAARSHSKGSDWRKTPFDPKLWIEWSPPQSLREKCAIYRSRLGLEYAAFDFMVRDEEILFLEANQAGEWLFLDRSLDLGISEALAGHIATLAHDPAAAKRV